MRNGMENINYTIAVMIYNVEKYLPDCIESIIAQEGEDIEILLIDDGATDLSGMICDEYVKKDQRVRVIHQKNAGVAAARNTALHNAQGKWLIMVDGDDELTSDAIKVGRRYINDTAELLQFDAIPFVNNLSCDGWIAKGKEETLCGKALEEYHIQLIDRTNVNVQYPVYNINPAWGKMWNMDFIRVNGLLYDTTVCKGEGTLFTFTASYIMKQVRMIPYPIYGYRINPDSIMHRFSSDVLENQNVQWNQYYNVIRQYGEAESTTIIQALNRRGLYLIDNAIQLGISHPDCQWDKVHKLEWAKKLCEFSWVQQAVKYAVENGHISKEQKLILRQDYCGLVRCCNKLRWRKLIGEVIQKNQIGKIVVNIYRKIRYRGEV